MHLPRLHDFPISACAEYTVCYTMPDDWQFVFRTAFGTANFLASLVFFFLLRIQNAKRMAFTTDKKAKSSVSRYLKETPYEAWFLGQYNDHLCAMLRAVA